MSLLRTEYYCRDCDVTFKKVESEQHTRETEHHITKKIIHPNYNDEYYNVMIELTQEVNVKPQEPQVVDYCTNCKNIVVAPSLHRSRGHVVYKRKVS